jgi:hypothetical protein
MDWTAILSNAVYGLFIAGAVYGGIRGDIKHLHESILENKQATGRAHDRIDDILKAR